MTVIRRTPLTLVLTLALAAATVPAAQAQTLVGQESNRDAGLVRTEWTVQVTPHPLDQFKIVRLARDTDRPNGANFRGALLLLPPLGTTFSFYEQRDHPNARGTSIAEFFALRGYDVWGVSPRFEGIPAGTCEAGVLDCSVLAGWNLQSMLDDIAFTRAHLESLHPGARVATGGVSLGGILAIAVVNQAPAEYAGALVWEGMLVSDDATVQGLNQGYCAAVEGTLAAGVVYDGVGGNVFRAVTQYAKLAPEGLSPIPLFPPGFTNHQALVATLAVPAPGPVTMPVPGYVQTAGDLAQDRLFFASEERLIENVSRFVYVIPNALARDVTCHLAGLDTTHVDHLDAFTGSVLAIGGGHGFGSWMQDQLDRFSSADVRFLLEPRFGHIDHFMTVRHRQYVERPVLRWLQEIFD